jgi:hypothetical protein
MVAVMSFSEGIRSRSDIVDAAVMSTKNSSSKDQELRSAVGLETGYLE